MSGRIIAQPQVPDAVAAAIRDELGKQNAADPDFMCLAIVAIRALRASAPPDGVREAWQPIGTAPKQKVVLLWALTDTATGNWKMATGYWMPGYGDEPGQWTWDGHRLKPYDVQPTMWSHLPAAPALSPSDAGQDSSGAGAVVREAGNG